MPRPTRQRQRHADAAPPVVIAAQQTVTEQLAARRQEEGSCLVGLFLCCFSACDCCCATGLALGWAACCCGCSCRGWCAFVGLVILALILSLGLAPPGPFAPTMPSDTNGTWDYLRTVFFTRKVEP